MNEIIVTQMSTNYYGTVKKQWQNKQKEYNFFSFFLIYFYELLRKLTQKTVLKL